MNKVSEGLMLIFLWNIYSYRGKIPKFKKKTVPSKKNRVHLGKKPVCVFSLISNNKSTLTLFTSIWNKKKKKRNEQRERAI